MPWAQRGPGVSPGLCWVGAEEPEEQDVTSGQKLTAGWRRAQESHPRAS